MAVWMLLLLTVPVQADRRGYLKPELIVESGTPTGALLRRAEQLTGKYPERLLHFPLPAGKLASASWQLHLTYRQPERYALQLTVSLADPNAS